MSFNHKIIGLLWLSCCVAVSNAQPAPILLSGASVLAPDGTHFLPRHDIIVSGGEIVAVGPFGSLTVLPETKRVDVSGFTVIPGLIDLHSHLLLHPYDEASWNDQVLKESIGLRTIRAVPAMLATVQAGFTTVRDLGTEGAGYADVALRDAVTSGIVVGPRIFAATRALVATGCYGPSGFDPRWTMPKGGQVADGVDGVRRAVREQIAAGADWIKVYADYRRRKGDSATPTYSQEELAAAVHEARSAGLPVVAHATTNEAIRRAVLAGVKTIEHGSSASMEMLTLMKDNDVALCPTLAASEAMAIYGGWTSAAPEHKRIKASRELLARALKAGVVIGCGSDVGVFSHGDNARELELLVKYGMSNQQALASATIVAAKILGQQHKLGQITQGYAADLVVLKGDPLDDIHAVRDPAIVIANGQVVLNSMNK